MLLPLAVVGFNYVWVLLPLAVVGFLHVPLVVLGFQCAWMPTLGSARV